jgi:hypothetical protein
MLVLQKTRLIKRRIRAVWRYAIIHDDRKSRNIALILPLGTPSVARENHAAWRTMSID